MLMIEIPRWGILILWTAQRCVVLKVFIGIFQKSYAILIFHNQPCRNTRKTLGKNWKNTLVSKTIDAILRQSLIAKPLDSKWQPLKIHKTGGSVRNLLQSFININP